MAHADLALGPFNESILDGLEIPWWWFIEAEKCEWAVFDDRD